MQMTNRVRLLILAALSIASVGIWTSLLHLTGPQKGDAEEYVRLAENIRTHGMFATGTPPAPTNDREPGYPAFLAVIFFIFGGASFAGIVFAQSILFAGSALLMGLIVERWFPEKRFSPLVLTAAFVLSPIQAQYAGLVLTETLQTFLLLAAVWTTTEAIERKHLPTAVLASISWAALIMTRLSWLFLPFVILAAFVGRRDLPKKILVTLVSCVVLAAGLWSYRNHLALDNWGLTGRVGALRYVRAVKATYSKEVRASYWRATLLGVAFEVRKDAAFDYYRVDGWNEFRDLEDEYTSKGMSGKDKQLAYGRLSTAAIAAHPFAWGVDGLLEIWKLYTPIALNGPTTFSFMSQATSGLFMPVLAMVLLFIRLLTLALLACVAYGAVGLWSKGVGARIIVLTVLYHSSIYFFFDTISRYQIPAWPLVLFVAASACYDVVRKLFIPRKRQ